MWWCVTGIDGYWLGKNLGKIFGLNHDILLYPIYCMGEDIKRYKSRVWKCPKCGAPIRWSCNGATGHAHCANSLRASRNILLNDLESIVICNWEGFTERRPDGKVEIYYYAPI